MIKKVREVREQVVCDICGESASSYSESKIEGYDFCSDHSKMIDLAKDIVGGEVKKAREYFDNVMDQIENDKIFEVVAILVDNIKKYPGKKKSK